MESSPIEADSGRRQPMSIGSILSWACCLGIGSGVVELAVFWLKCRVLDPRNFNVSQQFPWMFATSGLILLESVGLVLVCGSRIVPSLATPRVVLVSLGFPAILGVLFRAPISTAACLALAGGLAWRGSSCFSGVGPVGQRRVFIGAFASLGALSLLVLGQWGRETWVAAKTEAATSPARNVILIVLDTVRADRLGLYGYARDTTPNLDRLARRGVRFERAFSTAPWTAPSHASLFTGRWPHELSIGWDRPLDSSYPTLAESLSSAGYATAGFVANTTYCSYETGLDRGFAHYEDYDVTLRGILLCSSVVERNLNFLHHHPALADRLGLGGDSAGDRKNAARVNRDFLGWLDGRSSEARPFFAFLNYYDAHHPYLAADPEAGARFGTRPESPRDFRLLRTWWERDKRGIVAKDLELARDSYDRCIAYLDNQLGRLFEQLEKRGELGRSIVIVTSDHGEHLGEHELFGHGCSVYRPELSVPLLVVAPGLCPGDRSIDRPVSLRDLPATVFDLASISGACPFPGRSLATLWKDGPIVEPEPVVSEVESAPEGDPNGGRSPASRGPMISMVSGDYHYIEGADGRVELFDLRHDSEETNDLAAHPKMAEVLDGFRAHLRR